MSHLMECFRIAGAQKCGAIRGYHGALIPFDTNIIVSCKAKTVKNRDFRFSIRKQDVMIC